MLWRCPTCRAWVTDEIGPRCEMCAMTKQVAVEIPKPDWWTTDEWSTPQALFDELAAKHGPFDLDACTRPDVAKCAAFYTKDDDGLAMPWFGSVWINPPYSDPSPWCQRAADLTDRINTGYDPAVERVVMLLPAAVDTRWFHRLVVPYADWYPLEGRPRFIGWAGVPVGSPKGGNVVAIYPKGL